MSIHITCLVIFQKLSICFMRVNQVPSRHFNASLKCCKKIYSFQNYHVHSPMIFFINCLLNIPTTNYFMRYKNNGEGRYLSSVRRLLSKQHVLCINILICPMIVYNRRSYPSNCIKSTYSLLVYINMSQTSSLICIVLI